MGLRWRRNKKPKPDGYCVLCGRHMQTGVMGEITPLRRGVLPQEDELCEDCGPRGFMPRRNAEWERLDEPEGGERLRRSTALGFPETYSEGWNSLPGWGSPKGRFSALGTCGARA